MWPAGHIWDENHVCTVCGKQGTDVASLRWSGVAARYSYSGKSVRPTPKVYDGDYQLTLSNNVTSARDGLLSWFHYWEPGMAAVEVQGSGDYYGRIRIEYRPSARGAPQEGFRGTGDGGCRANRGRQVAARLRRHCLRGA